MLQRYRDVPTLFPPHKLELDALHADLGISISLVNLHLWMNNDSSRRDVSEMLQTKLQVIIDGQ